MLRMAWIAAVGVLLVGCGGSHATAKHETRKEAEESIRQPPTPEETAVLKMAQQIYSSQNITAVICRKIGFVPAGDVDSCILRSADGTETNSSDWTVLKLKGQVVGAEPGNDSSGESAPEPTPLPNQEEQQE